MNRRRSLADRFFASSRWGIGRQLAAAAAVILVASALIGAVGGFRGGESSAGVPSQTTQAIVQPARAFSEMTPLPTTTTSLSNTTALSVASLADNTGSSVLALDVLGSIPIEREHPEGYSRDLFAVWSDLDGDGCDTRAEVLIEESLTPAQVDPSGCAVVAGDWLSSYDGITFTSPGELDIDHLVALKETWDSGAWQWSVARRIAYANDMSDPRTLSAVSSSVNRQKSDQDPSNWLPDDSDVCRFISDWVAVKARWSLSMDESEAGRIRSLLDGQCVGITVTVWPAATDG